MTTRSVGEARLQAKPALPLAAAARVGPRAAVSGGAAQSFLSLFPRDFSGYFPRIFSGFSV